MAPRTCIVAVSVGDVILRVEVVVVVRGRGGVPGARPLGGHQAAGGTSYKLTHLKPILTIIASQHYCAKHRTTTIHCTATDPA